MVDRSFTEVELRRMLQSATSYEPNVVPGRFTISSTHEQETWHVIVEPDADDAARGCVGAALDNKRLKLTGFACSLGAGRYPNRSVQSAAIAADGDSG